MGSTDEAPPRLRAEMASLRLLVLDFVRAYFARWGASPSYGEIAAGLATNRTRIRKAVKSLAADGLLLRAAGPRGLALPDACSEAAAMLRALGWQVVSREAAGVTNGTLPGGAALDYLPADCAGADGDGRENEIGGENIGGRDAA